MSKRGQALNEIIQIMIKEIVFNGIKDFNLVHIFECGQCFRWNKEDEDSYIGIASGYVARATFNNGTLTLEVSGGDEAFWGHYLDLETDYKKIKSTLINIETANLSPMEQNRVLKPVPDGTKLAIEYGYGIRILNQDIFETMISFIVSQNNNIPRIKKCIEAICERYGEPLGTFWGKERFAFPSAEALAKATPCALAELGLGYRNEYIPRAARQFLEEGTPSSYEQVLSYHGIGPKVANCIMLFGLHKVDAFPIDTWVKHIMNDMYGFEESDTRGMANFAKEIFGSFAGYMQQYLFYYYRDRK